MLHDVTPEDIDKSRIEAIYALKYLHKDKDSRILEIVQTQQQIIRMLYWQLTEPLDLEYNSLDHHSQIIDTSEIHIIADNGISEDLEETQDKRHLRAGSCDCKRKLKKILKGNYQKHDYDNYRISILDDMEEIYALRRKCKPSRRR